MQSIRQVTTIVTSRSIRRIFEELVSVAERLGGDSGYCGAIRFKSLETAAGIGLLEAVSWRFRSIRGTKHENRLNSCMHSM